MSLPFQPGNPWSSRTGRRWCVLLLAVLLAVPGYLLLRPGGPTPDGTKPLASVPRLQLETRAGLFHQSNSVPPFTGWMTDAHPDGSLKLRTAVVDGRLHGVSEGWYTNGVMELSEHFDRGVTQGPRTTWYPTGQLRSEGQLVAGLQQGTYRQWHENGALAAEVGFQDGKAQGLSLAWYPDGSLKAEALMKNGLVEVRHFYATGERREPVLLAATAHPQP